MKSGYIILLITATLFKISFTMEQPSVPIQKIPRVFLGNWENKTKYDLNLGFFINEYTDIFLKPDQKKDLNIENKNKKPQWSIFWADKIPGAYKSLQIYYNYDSETKKFTVTLYTRFKQEGFSSQDILITAEDLTKDVPIIINGVIEGDNFENSKISITKHFTAASLLNISIKYFVDLIKSQQLTLDQIKQYLPIELVEKIEAALK